MTSSQEHQNPDNLPVVFLHRLPRFNLNFKPWLQPQFCAIDPNDPSDTSFSTQAQSVRVLLCVGPTPVTSKTFDEYPSLELVVGSSTGINHVDLDECRRRGVKVTNAGDAFSEDAADYAIGLFIDVHRRVSGGDRYVRAGSWPVKGDFPLGSKIGGKRVGIVGLGGIGSKIATRLEGFGCKISYNSRKKKPHVSFPYYANIHDLASNSDSLIICCSLTDETHHIINKDVLTALGKKGVIVNVGRGALVDEKELVKALVQGEIAGAGLDVFENEPDVPEELFALDNVVLSPHKAIATAESIAAVQEIVVGNIEAFFANRPLLSEIELE